MADSATIKKFQMIHKLPQTGTWSTTLSNAIKKYQKDLGIPQTGVIDSTTLAKYKQKWPYAWGLTSSPSTPTSTTTGGIAGGGDLTMVNGMMDKVIGGIILYGIFRVAMKVF